MKNCLKYSWTKEITYKLLISTYMKYLIHHKVLRFSWRLRTTTIKNTRKNTSKKQEQSAIKNLGKITKEFTIGKFNGKNSHADQWITIFEKECERFNIIEDEKRIEILKSFMGKGATDWYGCTLLKLTIEAQGKEWKKNLRYIRQ